MRDVSKKTESDISDGSYGETSGAETWRRIGAAVVTLLLAAAGVFLFLWRDRLGPEQIRSFFNGEEETLSGAGLFSYAQGSGQAFALMGDGLAEVSSSGLRVFRASGELAAEDLTAFSDSAVAACKNLALFYDIGGTVCKAVFSDGTVRELDAGDGMVSASVNDSGYIATVCLSSGSRALTRVYSPQAQLLYEWYSGSGYAVSACVSPNNRMLAVLCVNSGGSAVHLFRLNAEEEAASYTCDGELLFQIDFMSSDRLCAAGDKGLYFLNADGEEISRFSFQDARLAACDFSGTHFITVCLTGGAYSTDTLLTLDPDGKVLGSTALNSGFTSLSVTGRKILLASPSGLTLFSENLEEEQSREMLFTAKKALLRPKGDVLLLSSYGAEVFSFT